MYLYIITDFHTISHHNEHTCHIETKAEEDVLDKFYVFLCFCLHSAVTPSTPLLRFLNQTHQKL